MSLLQRSLAMQWAGERRDELGAMWAGSLSYPLPPRERPDNHKRSARDFPGGVRRHGARLARDARRKARAEAAGDTGAPAGSADMRGAGGERVRGNPTAASGGVAPARRQARTRRPPVRPRRTVGRSAITAAKERTLPALPARAGPVRSRRIRRPPSIGTTPNP
jgi:hypothetical protein